jgi:hypothetical protein
MAQHSNLIGGSTCARRMACPGSYRLELKAPAEAESSYAKEGTFLHHVIEKCLNDDVAPQELVGYEHEEHKGFTLTQDLIDEQVKPALTCVQTLLEEIGADEFELITEAEVGYPGIEDSEGDGVFGTTDLLIVTDDTVVVGDFKFGRGVMVQGGLSNKQLKFYAGACMRSPKTAHYFEDRDTIVLAIIQPANPLPLQIVATTQDYISAFADEVETLAHRLLEEDDLPLKTGDHCRFCNAAVICPSKREQAQIALTMDTSDPFIDPVEFGQLLKMADEVEGWAKSLRSTAYNELKKGRPVAGYKLVEKRRTRSWVNEGEAADRLRALGINDPYDRKLVSPSQAEKSVKAAGGKPADLADIIEARSPGLTMAAADDRRPAVEISHDEASLAALKLPETGV